MMSQVSKILFLTLSFTLIASAEDVSDEAARAQEIANIYQTTLGRPADAQEIAKWNQSGLSISEIQERVEASPEGQNVAASRAAPTGHQAVIDLYRELFGRDPDANEVGIWTPVFFGSNGDIEMLRQMMMTSQEYPLKNPPQ